MFKYKLILVLLFGFFCLNLSAQVEDKKKDDVTATVQQAKKTDKANKKALRKAQKEAAKKSLEEEAASRKAEKKLAKELKKEKARADKIAKQEEKQKDKEQQAQARSDKESSKKDLSSDQNGKMSKAEKKEAKRLKREASKREKMDAQVSQTPKTYYIPPAKKFQSTDPPRSKTNGDGEDQASTPKRNEADKMYKNLGYKKSAELYHADRGTAKYTMKELIQIADSYRLNHQTEDAEYWYSRVVTDSKEPIHMLHYAQALLSNGKCEDAIRWFREYNSRAKRKDKIGLKFIRDCDELNEFIHKPFVEVTNMSHMNSEFLDFAAVSKEGQIVFSSTREEGNKADKKDKWTNEFYSDLFYVYSDDPFSGEEPRPLQGEINQNYHDGVATFNVAGSEMLFSRNYDKKNKDGFYNVKIVSAQLVDGKWKDVSELPFNSKDYRTCHPALSPDGRRIYFSSDRPGGFGGMDIYVSHYKSGDWTQPVNLGPSVNTAENELFPFMNDLEELYFSSNGHKGLGGLDIFKVIKTDVLDENSWGDRINIGTPFNSPKDDFAYVEIDASSGFFSSSRIGGYGKDDIYKWENTIPVATNILSQDICVINEANGEAIPEARIIVNPTTIASEQISEDDLVLTLKPDEDNEYEYLIGIKASSQKDQNGGEEMQMMTDRYGRATIKMDREDELELLIVKNGFTPAEAMLDVVSYEDGCFEIPMRRKECLMLHGQVSHLKYPHPIPNAELEVFSLCTGEVTTLKSDQDGKFEACLDCECEYEVRARKDRFSDDVQVVSTLDRKCNEYLFVDVGQGDLRVELKLDLGTSSIPNNPAYTPSSVPQSNQPNIQYIPYPVQSQPQEIKIVPMQVNPETQIIEIPMPAQPTQEIKIVPVPADQPDVRVIEVPIPAAPEPEIRYVPAPSTELPDEGESIDVGMVIELPNIFYDFDKYDIRNDAQKDLDKVVAWMKSFPSLKIELASHTDSRGKSYYNKWLSRKRAKAAIQYIASKGISEKRLRYKGYGETDPRNHCVDGKDCSEEEHQYNRRTEVRVLSFRNNEVKVLYEDTQPEIIDYAPANRRD